MSKQIDEKIVYKGKRFTVTQRKYVNDNGMEYTRDIVNPGDAAIVLPITENNEVVFIKQFRESVGKVAFELPAGMIDKGEEPIHAAVRELEEETGLIAKEIIPLISVYPSIGYTTEKLHIFVAKDFSKGKVKLDDDEEILSLEKVPIEKCFEMAKNNKLELASQNIAILMYYFKYYNK